MQIKYLLTVSMFMAGTAFAQTDAQTTVGSNLYEEPKTIKDEVIGIQPQVGVITYTDISGTQAARGVAGFGLNFNFPGLAENKMIEDAYLGISTGIFYSHLGASSSNIFGSNASAPVGSDTSKLLLIPANLKVGSNITDSFRISAHGGGNLIYRSVANSTNLGSGSVGTDDIWKVYPNAGLDFELQVGENVSLVARPDFTFTGANDIFLGTLGATIMTDAD